MKYYKKANIYKASNVSFDPETKKAISYDWWCFCLEVKGKVIFNNAHCSPSTTRHQRKVRDLMLDLGIGVDLELRFILDSLDNAAGSFISTLKREIGYSRRAKKELQAAMEKPRSRKATNNRRKEAIVDLNDHIAAVEAMIEYLKTD